MVFIIEQHRQRSQRRSENRGGAHVGFEATHATGNRRGPCRTTNGGPSDHPQRRRRVRSPDCRTAGTEDDGPPRPTRWRRVKGARQRLPSRGQQRVQARPARRTRGLLLQRTRTGRRRQRHRGLSVHVRRVPIGRRLLPRLLLPCTGCRRHEALHPGQRTQTSRGSRARG